MDDRYDTREALALLHGLAEELDPDLEGRRKAAEALLEELIALDGKTRIHIKRGEKGQVFLSLFSRRAAVVVADRDGGIFVDATPGLRGGKEVSLLFNAATERLESPKDDEHCPTEAGKPRAKRSALAEVVGVALGFLRPPP